MKVSKITVSICALLDILVGCLIANIPETYTLALNILLGVFTGLFVSIVTSLICYFHEKITIISKAKSQLPDVYIDLLIVQQMTGSILPRIIHTYRLDDLNYRTVISISDLAVHAIDKNSLKLYSPFLQYGKKAKFVRDIDQFEDKLYNLGSTEKVEIGEYMQGNYNIYAKKPCRIRKCAPIRYFNDADHSLVMQYIHAGSTCAAPQNRHFCV